MAATSQITMPNGPSWKIETRYSPKVLIGNWQEERLVNQKEYHRPISTYSIDFKNYPSARPDVLVRRHTELANDGLGKDVIFGHGTDYRRTGDMISWYDEHYNRRERDEANKLPQLRHFSSGTLTWVPEKSDYPITGTSTNYGLRQKLRQQWTEEINEALGGPTGSMASSTTYRTSFVRWPRSIYVTSKVQNARSVPPGTRPESTVYSGNAVQPMRAYNVVKPI